MCGWLTQPYKPPSTPEVEASAYLVAFFGFRKPPILISGHMDLILSWKCMQSQSWCTASLAKIKVSYNFWFHSEIWPTYSLSFQQKYKIMYTLSFWRLHCLKDQKQWLGLWCQHWHLLYPYCLLQENIRPWYLSDRLISSSRMQQSR